MISLTGIMSHKEYADFKTSQVAFFIGVVGVVYQLVGLMASERELGMTQIIEASMPNERRWEPQAVRLLANHIAFDIMFLPGMPSRHPLNRVN